MNNSIYRYKVTYIFCGQENEREYIDFQNAVKDTILVLNRNSTSEEVVNSIRIREIEYASEKNLKNNLSLQIRLIWSNCFHNFEDLKVLAGKSNKFGCRFTYNGESTLMKEYRMITEERKGMVEVNG